MTNDMPLSAVAFPLVSGDASPDVVALLQLTISERSTKENLPYIVNPTHEKRKERNNVVCKSI